MTGWGGLLAELVPIALGLALTPTAIATGILMLSSRRPVGKAAAFAAPFALVYGALAVVVLVASGAASEPLLDPEANAVAALVVGLVLLAIGISGVVRRRRHPSAREADKAGLLERVDAATPPTAFDFGLAFAALNERAHPARRPGHPRRRRGVRGRPRRRGPVPRAGLGGRPAGAAALVPPRPAAGHARPEGRARLAGAAPREP